MAVLQVSWFDGEKYWDNNSVYYKTWLLKKHMIPFEKFEFLKAGNPEMKISWLGIDTSMLQEEQWDHNIKYPYIFDKEWFMLLNNSLLWVLWADTIDTEKSCMSDAIETFIEEVVLHINNNLQNNNNADYNGVFNSLIGSSFQDWFAIARNFEDVIWNENPEWLKKVLEKYKFLENISTDIINRYMRYKYSNDVDSVFYNDMVYYQDNYYRGLYLLQQALIGSLKFAIYHIYDLQVIDDDIKDAIKSTYQQLMRVSCAMYYLEKVGE